MLKSFTIAALSILLLSCAAYAQEDHPYPAVDTAPSASTGPSAAHSGTSTGSGGHTGGTAQTCTDSCNRSYDGCMDHDAAIPGNDFTLRNSNNAASNLIGGASDCKDDLRSCLNQCGG